jgi:uncharacterized protein YheU (UPF0270 family)
VVPHAKLSEEVLRGVVEAFVLREGTDYGAKDFSLEQKAMQVMQQLNLGEAQIIFDPTSQTVDVVVSRAGGRRR